MLQELQPKIVLCEDASEVFKTHLHIEDAAMYEPIAVWLR
jgi:hypothetical protein